MERANEDVNEDVIPCFINNTCIQVFTNINLLEILFRDFFMSIWIRLPNYVVKNKFCILQFQSISSSKHMLVCVHERMWCVKNIRKIAWTI